LFDTLIPAFNETYPQYNVKVVAVGSGEALKLGQTGDADVLLVHSPAAEKTFMDEGFGVERKAVMYNDFIVVGPPADPAAIKGMTDAAAAFAQIARARAAFYSRGDNSGTHAKELALWKAANIVPEGVWYQTTGQGMGETLTIADQKGGYTLSDRATYLSKKNALGNLAILVEGDKALFNQYHVITTKAAKNAQGAEDFMNWIVSEVVQQGVIAKFGVDKYGQALFVPNAGQVE
jgi:tungstate transport system substrate-binding protein